jgi:hypothetical protein
MSLFMRRVSHPTKNVKARGLCDVEVNLSGLTMGIPDIELVDVPYYLHRHTVGVLESIICFLHRISRAVVCYHEHNEP